MPLAWYDYFFQMKLSRKILLLWIPQVLLVVLAAIVDPSETLNERVGYALLGTVGSLLGVTAYILHYYEFRMGSKAVFFNFAALFETNVILGSVYGLLKSFSAFPGQHSDQYIYQLFLILYFFLLSVCVVFLVIDSAVRVRRVYEKYVVTLVVCAGVCGFLFHAFFENPRYLVTTRDYQDYSAVLEAYRKLEDVGGPTPSTEDIVSIVVFAEPPSITGPANISIDDKTRRVTHVLSYVIGNRGHQLYYRPLFIGCVWMSILCILFALIYVIFRFLKDPPEGAYIEKMVWCMLLFCSIEALHYTSYVSVDEWQVLLRVHVLGAYISVAVMIALLTLFSLRLKTLLSVEGRYYERQLVDNASGITRWRDGFDNWVLRQFMNPGELERRFLVRRKSDREDDASTNKMS